MGASAVAIALWLISAASPGYGFTPADSIHYRNPTAQSSWDAILKWPGIEAQFPMVAFGNRFVSLQQICLAGDTLRIADPGLDNGIQVAAAGLRAQARTALGDGAARPADRLAAVEGGASNPERIRYPVTVYRVFRLLGTTYDFLFEKPWDVPTCALR